MPRYMGAQIAGCAGDENPHAGFLSVSYKASEVNHAPDVEQSVSDHRHQEVLGPCEEQPEVEALKYRPQTDDPNFLLAEMCQHEQQGGGDNTECLLRKTAEENFLTARRCQASEEYLDGTRVRIFAGESSGKSFRVSLASCQGISVLHKPGPYCQAKGTSKSKGNYLRAGFEVERKCISSDGPITEPTK